MRLGLDRLHDPGEIAVAAERLSLDTLMHASRTATLDAHGPVVTYSRKIFIPLTRLCRDVCHYCTFATTPAKAQKPFLSLDETVKLARRGEAAGCREALFTLGDRPEARYAVARDALATAGCSSTLAYLAEAASAVLTETSLLPHLNAGVMGRDDYRLLRTSAASMGLMLESTAVRLCARGGPHYGSPDKRPERRLAAIAAAGVARVPFTTGLLIGIGETRAERIEALSAIRDVHTRHGHIQEVIIQNFKAKPGTRMAQHPEPSLEEQLWTIAMARLVLGPEMSIQAPPNLRPHALAALVAAGVNDWGGVSPVTPDHVNPEAPWPHLEALERATNAAGRVLRQRLAIGPRHAQAPDVWLDPALAVRVRRAVDARGLPITEQWRAGGETTPPCSAPAAAVVSRTRIPTLLGRLEEGRTLADSDIAALFEADDAEADLLLHSADAARRRRVGDDVTFVINRNINYTNVCAYRCGFCAFSKGGVRDVRGPAYRLDLDEIARRAAEAKDRGATEVCLQGGIHPAYDGDTYLDIIRAVRSAAPKLHIHAFSPLEVTHGARTLGLSLSVFLGRLRAAGLSSLPGTAAEVLHDDVRDVLCPDKIRTAEWLDVMRTAHREGLRSTATIMFGHIDAYRHWAAHLSAIRQLQEETGGFTEFVPLPFVHMEAPIWRKGTARSGPSFREALLMHAIARLVLGPAVANIQTSWVKMGPEGAAAALRAGANDVGGTLMDESITRAAGGAHGQSLDIPTMRALAGSIGRPLRQRTTLYGAPEKRGNELY